MKPAFHPDSITIDTKGGHKRSEAYLGNWSHPRDSKFGPLWNAANTGASTARVYFDRRQGIAGDADLSDAAKARRLGEIATAQMRDLAQQQRRLNEARSALVKERQALTPVKPYSGPEGLAMAVVDAEIARSLRELPQEARNKLAATLAAGQNPRVVEAVLRLPAVASGLTDNMRGVIETAAISREHPEEVELHQALEEAAETAQRVLKQSTSLVLDSAGMSLGEAMQALGGEWRGLLPAVGSDGAMDAIARRHVGSEDAPSDAVEA